MRTARTSISHLRPAALGRGRKKGLHIRWLERICTMFEPLLPVNFLRRAARLFPDKVAVVDGERRDTYRTLAARVNRLSNALRRMGVGRGDKVAVLSPNGHRLLEAFFAVPQLGAVLTPLNYRLSAPEFAYIP